MHTFVDNPHLSIDDFAQLVLLAIQQRATPHIRDLRVEATPEIIIIHGRANSYYGLQLAIEAARPYVHSEQPPAIKLALEIVRPPATCRELD